MGKMDLEAQMSARVAREISNLTADLLKLTGGARTRVLARFTEEVEKMTKAVSEAK